VVKEKGEEVEEEEMEEEAEEAAKGEKEGEDATEEKEREEENNTTECAWDHYSLIEGNCVLKSCSARTNNNSTTDGCGPGECFGDTNNGPTSCAESCSNLAHYTADTSSKRCVLKECAARAVNSSTFAYPSLCVVCVHRFLFCL
jgi:hypothetical protein